MMVFSTLANVQEKHGEDRGVVHPLTFVGDDHSMVEAILAGHPGASAAMYDRYSDHVYRVLVRIMGFDDQLQDLLQEVFMEALRSVGSLRKSAQLKAWLTAIAVHTARACIRKRTRRRWLQFRQPDKLPERIAVEADDETREALEATYEVLGLMPAQERIAFSLRFIDGMELTEVAEACGVSLATVKRRLLQAQQRFIKMASRRKALEDWLEKSPRWRDR